jgi:leucyl aminopeptidase
MIVESFYQTSSKHSVPIILLSNSEYNDQLESLSAQERNLMISQQFKARLGEVIVVPDSIGTIAKVYIGSGEESDGKAIAYGVNRLPEGSYSIASSLSQLAKVNWSLAQYRFDRYKQSDVSARILTISSQDMVDVLIDARAVFYIRDLINTPASDLGPEDLSQALSDLASENKAEFEQFIGDDLLKNNYPAIHAVGRAAKDEPRLLSLTWGDISNPLVSIIGKGVSFDSGGLDIKPANAMRIMKKDMGGAAIAMGLAQWIMSKGLAIRLQVLIPAVENSISADSFRPGDVLTMRNGLTVEVDNTDAEGRLVLADALVRSCEGNPELIIDFATLTGAARAAVGTDISAMFTDDEILAKDINEAAIAVKDPVCRLPLFSGYNSLLESSVADLVNSSSSPYAGAITAALFLQRFVDKNIPWAHFDIMAWNVGSKPGKPEGGEAMAMQALAYYLARKYG